ncbi:hypothetical protein HEK46_022725 [Escherichia coli]|uniref:hypothetical protein n=1 Tax=Escherichia coli TaxID=562 RepID=UPI000BE35F70|nr:hypothetical protein [Escherichia coli]EGA4246084.1 hypothetical protein [Salmonella enterica]EFC4407122.1 hypothetical protein [Escherichia coli]EFO1793296.1 hypothetical protein [Escherichia coli]EIQ0189045.1 hypothetical protein [Escherichia coli]EKC6274193.1 hypothetical protein [Escherichia coli]
MLLLTTTFSDYLTPDDKVDIPYYDKFISQFTKMTISCVVSQCNLMPEMFQEDRSVLEHHINDFIKGIPDSAKQIRKNYKHYCLACGISPGHMKQEKEQRTFSSEYFIKEAEDNKISCRELILRTMNANAFLNYFFLIEETIKSICLEVIPSDVQYTGKDTISKLLKSKIKHEGFIDEFNKELYERSQFFLNFKALIELWRLLNLIRNRYVHYNNTYDSSAKKQFSKLVDKILEELKDDDLLLTCNLFINEMEIFEGQLENSDSIVFNDALENIIRNTSVFIMESLYVCERNKKLKNKK